VLLKSLAPSRCQQLLALPEQRTDQPKRAARLVPTSRGDASTPLSGDPDKSSDAYTGIVTCSAQTRQSLQGLEQGGEGSEHSLPLLQTPWAF